MWELRNASAGTHVDTRATAYHPEHVNTLRGLACVLLVAFHAIGGTPDMGLRLGPESYWRVFADLLMYLRMPIFAFISGLVYASRPLAGEATGFVFEKARRLLLPMLFVGTSFAVVRFLTTGISHENWATLHIVPVSIYWYLESLFVIFVVIVVLERLRLLNSPMKAAWVLAAAVIVQLAIGAQGVFAAGIFGLRGAAYLFPYFLCGLICLRFSIRKNSLFAIAVVLFVGAYVYAAAGRFGYVPASPRICLVSLLIGVSGCFILLRSGWNNQALAFIGVYSYAIYLFHVFFTASTRMAMYELRISTTTVLVFVSIAFGVVGPMIVARTFNRVPIARTVLLGKRWSNPDTQGQRHWLGLLRPRFLRETR